MSLELEVSGDVTDDDSRMAFVAVELSSVVLRCSFLADPEPNVVWLLNGQPIDTDQPKYYMVDVEYEISNRAIGNFTETLTIISVVMIDSGNYTCMGSNIHGSSLYIATKTLDVIG